jgi:L-ascorbate metabolism protein UlaG (beta-lactamase superfamily)
LLISRIDDHQSWRIACGRQRLLVDPWLVDDLEVGPGGLWLRRTHGAPVALRPRDIASDEIVVLTSPRADHAHLRTLTALDRGLRVIGAPAAIRLARRLGFRSTIALAPGMRVVLEDEIALTALRPRLPYGSHSIGILFESLVDGVRAYLEPHRAPEQHPLLTSPVDVLILPVQQVRVRHLGVALAMDMEEGISLARRLDARLVLATGTTTGPLKGLLGRALLEQQGGLKAFEALASLHLGEGRGRVLRPGERVRISPRSAQPARPASRALPA